MRCSSLQPQQADHPEMDFTTILADPAFLALLGIVAIGGLVQGFSGFGAGMVIGPVAAALYSPQSAVVILFVVGTLPMIPLVVGALGKVQLREILPILVGFGLTMPLGVWFLKTGDTTVLRWFISITILLAVAVLWSGWRYTGPRNPAVNVGVGAASGFLGGAASIAGPPVILYWMALRTGSGHVRANLIVFLTLSAVFTALGLVVSGIVTTDRLARGIACSPVFIAALFIGARLFGLASDSTYRRIAYTIVTLAAVLALPALDGLRS